MTHATLVNEHRSSEKAKKQQKKSHRFLEEAKIKNALLSFAHANAERKSFLKSILKMKMSGDHAPLVHYLAHSNFDLVSSLLALFVARKVAQMTTEMIECYHLR